MKARKSSKGNYRFQLGILIKNRDVRSGLSFLFPFFSFLFRPFKARRDQVRPGLIRSGLSGHWATPPLLSPGREGFTPLVRMGPPRRPKWVRSIGVIDPCWAFWRLLVDFFSHRFFDVFSIALLVDVCIILAPFLEPSATCWSIFWYFSSKP